ncbi:MAG: hypothetical protein M1814_003321 [Vezdaea aestivalis]|nr:MAG: hypothetical protein M1814_003321 [Vezdaea aestivalis]
MNFPIVSNDRRRERESPLKEMSKCLNQDEMLPLLAHIVLAGNTLILTTLFKLRRMVVVDIALFTVLQATFFSTVLAIVLIMDTTINTPLPMLLVLVLSMIMNLDIIMILTILLATALAMPRTTILSLVLSSARTIARITAINTVGGQRVQIRGFLHSIHLSLSTRSQHTKRKARTHAIQPQITRVLTLQVRPISAICLLQLEAANQSRETIRFRR